MRLNKVVSSVLASLIVSSSANASGFQVSELTASQIGSANAGVAAASNDLTNSFYNAANLSAINHPELSVGSAAVFSRTSFSGTVQASNIFLKNNSGNTALNVPDLTGVDKARGDTTSILPNFFIAYPIHKDLTLGLSATSPFNWSNRYNRTTSMEWFTTENKLNVQALGLSLAYRVEPRLSFAAGLDAERVYASFTHFNNEHYFEVADHYDNESHTHVDGSGYGWHLGALFEPTAKTHLGIGYRSQVVAHLNGSSKFNGLGASTTAMDWTEITQNAAKMDLTLPAVTTLSASQELNNRITLLGTVSYTEWSKTSGLAIQNVLTVENAGVEGYLPILSNTTLLPALRDTWQVSLGSSVKVNDKWLLRGGIGFDQSAIANNRNRSPYLPDSDTMNLAIGTHYQLTHALGMDLGWMHKFIRNAGIDSFTTSETYQTSVADGVSKNSADIVGLQMSWSFV